MQRRDFFKTFTNPVLKDSVKNKALTIRPPYYENLEDFHKKCVECAGECANVCETNIIVIVDDKTPILDLEKNGCTFCDECAKACNFDVLNIENKNNINALIVIDNKMCLSWQKTMCFSCKDPCLDNAILFEGMFYPKIMQDICTSCGFCIKYCPTDAIKIVSFKS